MLVNLSLAIRYGPSLRSGPNLMVLVTYTWYYLCVFMALNALIALFKKHDLNSENAFAWSTVYSTRPNCDHIFAFDLSMLPSYSTTCILSEPWRSPFAFSLMMTLPIGLYDGVARL